MHGLTIIHLSDLHIGRQLKPSLAGIRADDLANLTAERLVADFKEIESNYSIPFRTEEILLIVTGDITNDCKCTQFESAIYFFRQLRERFNKCFRDSQILPEHIICIPGNHDLEIPTCDDSTPNPNRETLLAKYRGFKIFLEEVTDYSLYSRNFRLNCPYVNVTLPTPFFTQVIDINSCTGINCYDPRTRKERKQHSLSGTSPYLTSKNLETVKALLLKQQTVFRIALMHHHLADLVNEDGVPDDAVSEETLVQWLTDNGFSLLLSGHGHAPGGQRRETIFTHKTLCALSTGYSFIHGRALEKGNYYQIIRVESATPGDISVTPRHYSWGVNKPLDTECNRWVEYRLSQDTNYPIKVKLDNPLQITEFRDFLGTHDPKSWAVIAHCESSKFENFGILSPGETINASLLRMLDQLKGNLTRVDEDDEINWGKFEGKRTLFLVDSPHYNPYVNWVLNCYGTYLAGGAVQFLEELKSRPVKQRIEVRPGSPFKSDKREGDDLFDAFEDYLLIMRLPGIVPSSGGAAVEVPDFDTEKVIWVIAGIHSKASYAGALLFTPEKLQKFMHSLMKVSNGEIPEYFEAVYEIPKLPIRPEKPEEFKFLDNPVHFKVLRLKRDVAMADDLPSNVAVRFLDRESWKTIPIDTVHFDPVAACNFCCPDCIEKEVRERNLFLPLRTCARILCDLKAAGCKRLNFYGGEPTLHPEFATLLRIASVMGFDMLLVTNGSQLAKDPIKEAIIDEKQRIHLRVSLDGHSPESHAKSHGLKEPDEYFETIKKTTQELITKGVSVTVSFLLRPHIVHEIESASDFWKRAKATALVLRPVTETEGKKPLLSYNHDQVDTIQEVIRNHNGFVLTPDWFKKWLDTKKEPSTHKDYDICYSGFYRIAISPIDLPVGVHNREETVSGVTMTETDKAWISLCSYRRYKDDFGCPYPDNLREWAEKERGSCVLKVNPSQACDEIICCRDGFNRQVDLLLKKKLPAFTRKEDGVTQ